MRYVNTTDQRTETLWEDRFKSSVVESDGYLLACYRYVEFNPVRAGLVRDPGDYAWSSYAYRALGGEDVLIQDHDIYLALGKTAEARC